MVSSMIEVRLKDVFDEYGVYNVGDVICYFDKYLGYSYSDLFDKFRTINDSIVTKDLVISYCLNNYDKLYESKFESNINMGIIKKRISDYEVFCKILDIYKYKGINYLSLLNYLMMVDNGEEDEKFEKLLVDLEISHYKSVICGRDVVKILIALRNVIFKCDETVATINDMDTYNFYNFNSFSLNSSELYPRSSLVGDDMCMDKTSIIVDVRKRKVRSV